MDRRVGVRVVSLVVRGKQEESVHGVEDLLADELVPFLGQATFVDSFLVMEFDSELLLPRCQLDILQLLEGVSEHRISPHLEINLVFALVPDTLPQVLLDAYLPQDSFGLEIENLWNLNHQVLKLLVYHRLVHGDEQVNKLLVREEELYQVLHSGIFVLFEDGLEL